MNWSVESRPMHAALHSEVDVVAQMRALRDKGTPWATISATVYGPGHQAWGWRCHVNSVSRITGCESCVKGTMAKGITRYRRKVRRVRLPPTPSAAG